MTAAKRRGAAALIVVSAVALTACGPSLPETVIPGTIVTIGWSGELTSLNAVAHPTPGNVDVAELVRGDFGDLIDGEFLPDESFGTVSIVSEEPFTVRYDLAEPKWSDGIPLDAADLALGWAAASGALDPFDEEMAADVASDITLVDEFARAIEVTFERPVLGWERFVSPSVPAHIVGGEALELSDPMQAKQALITAITAGEVPSSVVEAWRSGLDVTAGELPEELRVSSGPYVIDELSEGGQSVVLVPNPNFAGMITSKVARVELLPAGDDPISELGERLTIAQVPALAALREPIRQLERTDHNVLTSHDGTIWAVLLNPKGVFAKKDARAAFLRALPAKEMSDRAAGDWNFAYSGTTSMVAAFGTRAYDIVAEDSGFEAAMVGSDDPAAERVAAGIAGGTRVCVLYEKQNEYAAGVYAALREIAADEGWGVVDCGSDDVETARAGGNWNAMIARVPVPENAAQIAEAWGSEAASPVVNVPDAARDALIAQYAETVDIYAAREVLAEIEASIVQAAVALPLATNPRVTVSVRDLFGVTSRNGHWAPLTVGATQWSFAP